jgi:hypothetical protein
LESINNLEVPLDRLGQSTTCSCGASFYMRLVQHKIVKGGNDGGPTSSLKLFGDERCLTVA